MKKLLLTLALVLTLGTAARAQFVVTDPTNIATSIINMAKSITETVKTTAGVVDTFQEAKKIYDQSKKYYDALKSVHDLVKDARKVRETILIVGDISTIYVDNFQKMLSDKNYSADELAAIGAGYAKLLEQGANMLLDLKEAVSVNGLSMSDKERMEIIDTVYRDVVRMRNLTAYYTRKNISVSMIRAKEQGDLERVVKLYETNERYW